MLTELWIVLATAYIKLTTKKPKNTKCLSGKTAIVTGGNAGMGFEICLNLASRGCKVIIADRDDSEESKKKIIEASGNFNVISKKLDLAKLKSVRSFAKDMLENLDKLDILVNNAGIGGCKETVTEDELNPVMQINYFGHFTLTHLLVPLLKKAQSGRILFASSGACYLEDLSLENLNEDTYHTYGNSKLAVLIASDYFATKLKNFGVTSNAYHPGLVTTTIYNSFTLTTHGFKLWFTAQLIKLSSFLIGKSPATAAEYIAYLATSEEFKNVTGKLFFEDRIFEKPAKANDNEFTNTFLKASENLSKLTSTERI